jgi:hypothetical protein
MLTEVQKTIGGHRHRPLCRRYPTSDIDISYSDIGTKKVGLNPFLQISEEFQYRRQLPFWYQTKSISDIPISKIDKSFSNDLSKIIKDIFYSLVPNPRFSCQVSSILPLRYEELPILLLDIGYRIWDKSLLRHPILFRSPRSSVRYRTFRYQAQSDIADHGYRTECPPLQKTYVRAANKYWSEGR